METSFYAALPLLYRWISDWASAMRWVVVSIPICIISSWGIPILLRLNPGIHDPVKFSKYTVYWFPAQFPVFLVGMAAFLFIKEKQAFLVKLFQRKWVFPVVLSVMVGLASLAMGYLPVRISLYIMAACCAIVIVSLSVGCGSLLVNRYVVALGRVSFGAYLYHQFSIEGAKKLFAAPSDHWNLAGILFFVVGSTWLLGLLSYSLIEKPVAAMGAKLSRRVNAGHAM